jgi:hypothetical protein
MASATQDLEGFVREALRHASRETVERTLLDAGWPEHQVRNALAAYAQSEFPIPVPRPRPYLSAREAFLFLVLFTTLYLSAFHLGRMLFEFINEAFPDAAVQQWGTSPMDRLRWSFASLVIAFPVFLFVSRLIGRELQRDPVRRLSPIRRWLTYITLFIAVTILICDFTTLVYNALGGELTIRFVLKVLVVAVIAGTIFWYYLRDLRREEHVA